MAVKSIPLTVRAINSDDWPLIENLFGEKGACGGCWCMYWRVEMGGKLWENTKGKSARQKFRALVESGNVHAVMAFFGEQPVGWCSFGKRSEFPRLMRSRVLQRPHEIEPWSIVCFYIHRKWRNKGIASLLLRVAAKIAFKSGAHEIEGYPVNTKSGKRTPDAFAWTGLQSIFKAAGFSKIYRSGANRDIYVQTKNKKSVPE